MGTVIAESKSVMKELWYAPIMWPIALSFEIAVNCEHWYTRVLLMPLLMLMIFIGVPLMLVPTVILFIGIFIASVIVAIVQMVRALLK